MIALTGTTTDWWPICVYCFIDNMLLFPTAANTRAFVGEVFRPLPPLAGWWWAVPSNALYFGSILAVQRGAAKTLELIRRREDFYNDLFGVAVLYPYYHHILNHSEKRLVRHNRVLGTSVLIAFIYANFFA